MIKIQTEEDIVLTAEEYNRYFHQYREQMKFYAGPLKTFEQFVREQQSNYQQLNG